MSLICVHNLNINRIYHRYNNLTFLYFCFCRLFSSPSISPEDKENFIKRLKTIKIQQKSSSTLKNAAVLVPFCKVNGELSLLYTMRKLNLKRHKGQVSFPGGKQDSKDSSLEITALRETEEELGISKSVVEIWGKGNMISSKEFNILPVVGYVGEIDMNNLKPNLAEVEFAFTVPLDHFYDSNNCKYTQYRSGQNYSSYTLPVFINSKHKIWGITALITHFVLRAFSPTKYKHEIKLISVRNHLN